MPFPGMNAYAMASKIIAGQAYTYFGETSRTTDDRGVWVTTYAPGVPQRDSIQPVPQALYEQLGLDLKRVYVMIYTSSPLAPVARASSGDQIEFNGARYEVQSATDWSPIDGWRGVLAIQLQATIAP